MTDSAQQSRLAIADRVAFVESADGIIYAASVPDGVPVVLEGPARLIWDAVSGVSGTADRDTVIAEVASVCDVDPEVIGEDVNLFLDALVDQGLLEER